MKKLKVLGSLVFILLLFAGVFLVSASVKFENGRMKIYNWKEKEVTIRADLGLGDEIAKVRLQTSREVWFNPSMSMIDPVGVLAVNSSVGNYKKFFEGVEFRDMNDRMREVNKSYVLKFRKINGERIVPDFECVYNSSGYCNWTFIGSHVEATFGAWENLTDKDMKKGFMEIGIFMDVKNGDKIDWIPTIFDMRLDEFAPFVGAVVIEGFVGTQDDTGSAQCWGHEFLVRNGSYKVVGISIEAGGVPTLPCNMTLYNWNGTAPSTIIVTENVSCLSVGVNNVSFVDTPNVVNGTKYFWGFCAGSGTWSHMSDRNPPNYDEGGVWSSITDGINWTEDGGINANRSMRYWEVYGILGINSVNLTSPDNASTNYVANATFNCSAEFVSAGDVQNISLWINSTGTFHLNQTQDFSAQGNTQVNASFNLTLPEFTSHIWNCQAYNTLGSYEFADGNFSLNIGDITAPNITRLKPSATESSLTFEVEINASDNVGLNNCTYNITQGASLEIANTQFDISNLSQINDSVTVSADANYVFRTMCNDTSGIETVVNFNFTVSTSTTPTSSGGGGGGGVIEKIVELIKTKTPLCDPILPEFKEAYEIFIAEKNFENFKKMWFAFFNYSSCKYSASIIPVE